jgi:hypothetical protein
LGRTRFTFLASWLLDQNLLGEDPNVETLHLFSTEQYLFSKTDTVLQSLLMICISTALVGAACAEPSPTPNHITSRIPRQSVQSSAIAKVGYSKRRHVLEIEFLNGAVYRYFDVPVVVYRELMSSQSKARFYDSNVKRHYRAVLVQRRQMQELPEKSPASAQGYGATSHE